MKFNHLLPRIKYIAFELVEIDLERAHQEADYLPTSVLAIDLAVVPENLSYGLQARDAIIQTKENVYIDRHSFMPEQVKLSGVFGDDYRIVNGQKLDGWARLKMFENEIIRTKGTQGQKIYGVNYYDFLFQRFGHINIESWTLTGNARSNTVMPNYQLAFSIIGELITTAGLPALGLSVLNRILESGETGIGLLSQTSDIDDILKNVIANTVQNAIGTLNSKLPYPNITGKFITGVF